MYTDVGTIQPMCHQQEAGEPVSKNFRRAVLQDLDLIETLAELQHRIEGLTVEILQQEYSNLIFP